MHVEKADVYIENLLRLRLLRHVTYNETRYHPAGYNHYGDYDASVSNDEFEFIELTAFGRAFIDTCVVRRDDPSRGERVGSLSP